MYNAFAATAASVEETTATAAAAPVEAAATAATAKVAATETVTAVAAKAGAGIAAKIIAGIVAAAVIGVSVISLPDIVRNVHRVVQVQHSSKEQVIVQSKVENEGLYLHAVEGEKEEEVDAAFPSLLSRWTLMLQTIWT